MSKPLSGFRGLRSRFNRYLNFDDYAPAELLAIFRHFAENFGYRLGPETEAKVNELLTKLYERRDESFGNARDVRNIFERCITNQASRIVSLAKPDRDALLEIAEEDVPILESAT